MAQYNKYTIREGDTLQSIAQNLLNDSSRWVELVELNGLKFPFINTEINQSLANTVTIGDTILVPYTNLLGEFLSSREKGLTVDTLAAYSMGRDISILFSEEDTQTRGTTDETLEMPEAQKDLQIVSGYDNIKQSIITRLNTPKGSLLLHPLYGNTFHEFIGMPNTDQNISKLRVELEKTIRQDERIKSANVTTLKVSDDIVSLQVEVGLMSINEQYQMFINATNSSFVID